MSEAMTKQPGADSVVMPPLRNHGLPFPNPSCYFQYAHPSSMNHVMYHLAENICASIETTWSHAPRFPCYYRFNTCHSLAYQCFTNHFLLAFLFSSKALASFTANSLVLTWSIHVSRPCPSSLAHGTLTHLAPLSTL